MRDENPTTEQSSTLEKAPLGGGKGSPDDIDLFATLEVIWSKKWTAIAVALAITGAGLAYAELKLIRNPQYIVSAPYQLISPLYWGQEHCAHSHGDSQFLACSHRAALALAQPWQLNLSNHTISFTTASPSSAITYQEQLTNSAQQATAAAYKVVNIDLEFVEKMDGGSIADTETLAETMLAANRLINLLNTAGTLVNYGAVSIEPFEPSTIRRARLGAIGLGPVVGIFWVIFLNAFQTRYPRHLRRSKHQ